MTYKSSSHHVLDSFLGSGISSLVFIFMLLLTWSNASGAAVANYTKVITWAPPGDLLGDDQVEIGGLNGNYNWRLAVEASEQKHAFGATPSIPPKPTDPSPNARWLVKDGLASPAKTLATNSKTPHAAALAGISFSATKPVRNTISGSIKLRNEAVAADSVQVHGANEAKADSFGAMQVVGAKVTGVVRGKKGTMEIVPDSKISTLKDQVDTFGGAKHNAAAAISDPVIVGFVDVATGEVTESQIFSLLLSADFAKLEWDGFGLRINLQEGVRAKASIAFNITSDWVIDPPALESKLTFTKGNFQVSGIFASLPWVVQDTEVTLAAGYLDSISLSYAVPLDGTLLDDHVYTPYLTMSGEATVSESATVPEPSSLILVITGMAYLGFRHRRNAGLASVNCVPALRQV